MNHSGCDYLIAGAGIIGLALALELKKKFPHAKITIIEKEKEVAQHSSGRNSGVLHAGFYYTADSLKARFTAEGNLRMKAFCRQHQIGINECQKVVVAQTPEEVAVIRKLYERGIKNGVPVSIIDEKELKNIDPNAKTKEIALYSPTTATVDPVVVCQAMQKALQDQGVQFFFQTAYQKHEGNRIHTSGGIFETDYFINSAGLYADKIAHQWNFGKKYTIIPFKGIYLKYVGEDHPIRTNIYPVPNLKNPFLGVHFTVTADGHTKIGPTSIPAFWRENYQGLGQFRLGEFLSVLWWEAKLFWHNSFGFRDLAFEEIKKYYRPYFVHLATSLVYQIEEKKFTQWVRPGIRAQLLNRETLELVQDFVLEGDQKSLHVLNAVSPAFTCAFSFGEHIVEKIIQWKK